jgi:ankyrin repeat protein
MLISVYTSILGHSNEIWPSLLHFAAEFNLPKFCEELLKLPYSMDETFIMNKDSETPLEIAKRKDHIVVIKQLEHFTERETRNGKYFLCVSFCTSYHNSVLDIIARSKENITNV